MKYNKEEQLYMYRNLLNGRIYTEKMHEAVFAGHLKSFFHSPLGQEAIAVGIASAMKANPKDWIAFNHRDQCGSIMRFDPYQFTAELFAKKDGLRHGAAFDCHCGDFADEVRVLSNIGILGAAVPLYTGYAWALKLRKKDEVVVIACGDGAASEGEVYEAWNLAALYQVPALYVVENNQWALSTSLDKQSANPNLAEKAAAIGLPAKIIDGNDILAVREAVEEGIERARRFEPMVIEMKTLRWGAHFVGHNNKAWQDQEQVNYFKEFNDPLKRYETLLLAEGIIDEAYIAALREELTKDVANMVEKAAAAPIAEYQDVYHKEFVYATPETGGDL